MKLHCQVGNILTFPKDPIPQGAAHFAAFHWGESGKGFMWSLHLNASAWQEDFLELGVYPFIVVYRAGFPPDTRGRVTEEGLGFSVSKIEQGLREHFDPLAAAVLAMEVVATMETLVLEVSLLARAYIETRDGKAFTLGVRSAANAAGLSLELPKATP